MIELALKVKGHKIKLTVDEARELYNELGQFFGDDLNHILRNPNTFRVPDEKPLTYEPWVIPPMVIGNFSD